VDLVEFGQRDETLGAANPLASRWRSSTAPALAALGDVDDARRMAAEELDRARHWGTASGIGLAWHALALVDDERRLDHLRVAVKALEPSPARLDHARALTDLGAALRRANRRVDARAVLLQGLAMSERCSATVLAERARLELRAAGGRATDENSPGQLTTTERRVAELAVAGHSNPEIAQALFVTRKTVETHLGHVYRKLEITSRHELAAALSGNT
jgi:DNA-binding NarL/FixJ family response regulator